MNAIEVEGLSRTFNDLQAVDNISFTVEAGEIFGFLGHNGAGKTTTIRMLSGQLRPSAGRARVASCDVITEQRRLKALIGVVSENQNLYERMSGRENLAFAARLYVRTIDGLTRRWNKLACSIGPRTTCDTIPMA
jgi:ABC-2 type transport system ATP-binding protein